MFRFTLHDLLSANLRDNADSIAIVSGDQEISYQTLARRVDVLAAWLHRHGAGRGMRVGIHMRKSPEEIIATLACARVGATFVNISETWTPAQLSYIVEDCQIRILLTDYQRAKRAHQADVLSGLEHIGLTSAGKTPVPGTTELPNDGDAIDASVDLPIDADLAALLYTSGSTGKPKGVMVTHRNLIDGARSVASYLNNTSNDRILGLLPLCFDYGLSQLTTSLLVGATNVLQPVAMATEIVKTIQEAKVTGLAAVPPIWIQLVRYLEDSGVRLPSLRYVTNSGGKIPDAILRAMPDVFPDVDLYLMYGLTEAFRSTYLEPSRFAEKRGSMGRAIPNVNVFVVDEERGLCDPGQKGELIHRGSLISQGYWGNPEATDKKIRVCDHLRHLLGDEKVLFSGDIVTMDEDGDLWFVGRNDELMKCSGFRVSPTEVEELVFASGLVGDVVAFAASDEELGQIICVAVSARDGDELVDVAAIRRHCQKNMPNYMVPKQIHRWSGKMPRTGSGKIDRSLVRTAYLDG
ncbi:Long-chain-fatty-acid--CoA ligase [Stieleria maiorica]|uniref:Long-chain-fatty-acid--CoA ligase n=1 Tax=Stieleria maiorica TaxID=2795974 RepID=A0A5B9MGK5_9BACT|nr:AMP-binding protein [Stieleria maiorica]QEF99629.1 Long-chain-fatty-acid--CoA ligase [Stieleria maiorica]